MVVCDVFVQFRALSFWLRVIVVCSRLGFSSCRGGTFLLLLVVVVVVVVVRSLDSRRCANYVIHSFALCCVLVLVLALCYSLVLGLELGLRY